jgi:hypothetical protein
MHDPHSTIHWMTSFPPKTLERRPTMHFNANEHLNRGICRKCVISSVAFELFPVLVRDRKFKHECRKRGPDIAWSGECWGDDNVAGTKTCVGRFGVAGCIFVIYQINALGKGKIPASAWGTRGGTAAPVEIVLFEDQYSITALELFQECRTAK